MNYGNYGYYIPRFNGENNALSKKNTIVYEYFCVCSKLQKYSILYKY